MKKSNLIALIVITISIVGFISCDDSTTIIEDINPEPVAACMEFSTMDNLITELPRKVFFINNNEGWVRGYNANFDALFLYTNDGGENWIEMPTGLDFIEADAAYTQFHFINSTEGYLNTGYPETINYTTNKGASWQEIDFGNLNLRNFYGMASNSSQTIVAAKTSVVGSDSFDRLYFISNTMHQVVNDLLIPFDLHNARDIHFTDAGVINISHVYFSDTEEVKFAHSEDFGVNWTFTTIDMNSIHPYENSHDMVFPTDNVGYFTGYDSTQGTEQGTYIFKTTNGGATWNKIEIETHSGLNLSQLAFADENNGLALGHLAGDLGLYKTTNGGNNWELINCFNDVEGVITLTSPMSLTYPSVNKGFVLSSHNVNGDYEEFQPRLYKYTGQ